MGTREKAKIAGAQNWTLDKSKRQVLVLEKMEEMQMNSKKLDGRYLPDVWGSPGTRVFMMLGFQEKI